MINVRLALRPRRCCARLYHGHHPSGVGRRWRLVMFLHRSGAPHVAQLVRAYRAPSRPANHLAQLRTHGLCFYTYTDPQPECAQTSPPSPASSTTPSPAPSVSLLAIKAPTLRHPPAAVAASTVNSNQDRPLQRKQQQQAPHALWQSKTQRCKLRMGSGASDSGILPRERGSGSSQGNLE